VTQTAAPHAAVTDVPAAERRTDGEPAGGGLVEGGISDEELTALALAATGDERVDPCAGPDPLVLRPGALPRSYMPAAMPGPHGRWQAVVAVLLVAAFVTITGMGFCITYGPWG